jgi:uncharacterized protein
MKRIMQTVLICFLVFLTLLETAHADVQRVYDEAELLTTEEIQALEEEAAAHFEEWDTDFIILTAQDTEGQTIQEYMGETSDRLAEEFSRAEDNMVVLTLILTPDHREAAVNGFGRGEEYMDDARADAILDHIIPDLADGNYYQAFSLFYEKADDYLAVRPGVNPDSIFLNTFFQLAVSIILAGVIVFALVYRSGGRNTVSAGTYLDRNQTRVIRKRDRYLRKTVTRRKRPSSNNKSGGSGGPRIGGGMTGSGRSFSGSSRRF